MYVGRHDDLAALDDPISAYDRAGEMPCTCLWQFRIADGELNMSVYMRSWDLVWGLSYDVPSFVAVQAALAKDLGYAIGKYVHTAGSAHVYERHWELECWENSERLDVSWVVRDTIEETQERARQIMRKEER